MTKPKMSIMILALFVVVGGGMISAGLITPTHAQQETMCANLTPTLITDPDDFDTRGTAEADIILAVGGQNLHPVYGGWGDDIICSDPGTNHRIFGTDKSNDICIVQEEDITVNCEQVFITDEIETFILEPATNTIVVETDKTTYVRGEPILVSGTVERIIPNATITHVLKTSDGNLVNIGEADVQEDRTFSFSIPSDTSLLRGDVDVTIEVNYGEFTQTATAQFRVPVEPTTGEVNISLLEVVVEGKSVTTNPIMNTGETSVIRLLIENNTDEKTSLSLNVDLVSGTQSESQSIDLSLDVGEKTSERFEFIVYKPGTAVVSISATSNDVPPDTNIVVGQSNVNIAVIGSEMFSDQELAQRIQVLEAIVAELQKTIRELQQQSSS